MRRYVRATAALLVWAMLFVTMAFAESDEVFAPPFDAEVAESEGVILDDWGSSTPEPEQASDDIDIENPGVTVTDGDLVPNSSNAIVTNDEPTPQHYKATISKNANYKVNVGDTLKIYINGYTVTSWTSSKSTIASVTKYSDYGYVKMLKAGNVNITAKLSNKKKIIVKLKVTDPYLPTAVRLQNYPSKLNVGATVKFDQYCVLQPSYAKTTFKFTSSKKKILSINSSTGEAKALNTGTAKVTVTTANKKKTQVNISVVNNGGYDTVGKPVIYNVTTGTAFAPETTVEYQVSTGDPTLTLSATNGCGQYKIVVIALNEVPNFSDSNQSARRDTTKFKDHNGYMYNDVLDAGTYNDWVRDLNGIPIGLGELEDGQYLKIAVGAYAKATDAAPAQWTNIGLKIMKKSSYNADAAIDYAYQWTSNSGDGDHTSYNNSVYYAYTVSNGYGKDADCANYVSQCLFAGGLKQDNIWYSNYKGSSAWVNVDDLKSYLLSLGFTGYSSENINKSNIAKGDVIWTSSDHVMIVSKVINNTIYACGHTNNRKDLIISSIVYHMKMQ